MSTSTTSSSSSTDALLHTRGHLLSDPKEQASCITVDQDENGSITVVLVGGNKAGIALYEATTLQRRLQIGASSDYELENGEEQVKVHKDIKCLEAKHGRVIAGCAMNSMVTLWKRDTFDLCLIAKASFAGSITCAHMSPTLAVVSHQGSTDLQLLSLSDLSVLSKVSNGGVVFQGDALFLSGKEILTCSDVGTLKVHSVQEDNSWTSKDLHLPISDHFPMGVHLSSSNSSSDSTLWVGYSQHDSILAQELYYPPDEDNFNSNSILQQLEKPTDRGCNVIRQMELDSGIMVCLTYDYKQGVYTLLLVDALDSSRFHLLKYGYSHWHGFSHCAVAEGVLYYLDEMPEEEEIEAVDDGAKKNSPPARKVKERIVAREIGALKLEFGLE